MLLSENAHAQIHAALQPAVERFGGLSDEDQEAFRDALGRFVRVYGFLSLVVPFRNPELERDYLFCRALAAMIRDSNAGDLIADIDVQNQAANNDEATFRDHVFPERYQKALLSRMDRNSCLIYDYLDNEELQAAVRDIYAVIKTIAGFANSPLGGTLLVGVADDGSVHGLEDDFVTFSKRGERGDRDLWGQHLENLIRSRLGDSVLPLVATEFHTVDGNHLARISIDPSGFPVYERQGDNQVFWLRTPTSTVAVREQDERDRIIARRWHQEIS